nr:glutathione hydrolase 5 proenzyme-like [Pongo abelii]
MGSRTSLHSGSQAMFPELTFSIDSRVCRATKKKVVVLGLLAVVLVLVIVGLCLWLPSASKEPDNHVYTRPVQLRMPSPARRLGGFNFSAESVARPEGRVNVYHHLVEMLKFARGQRWRLRDPRSHPKLQNASRDLLGETLAQLIHQQIYGQGDHQLSHYSLTEAWGHGTGTSHVSVLGEDGSAVAATSTINTPFGAMVYSPRTGIILNNELLDLCERCPRGSGTTPSPVSGDRVGGAPRRCWPPVPGEPSPSSVVPSILINKAQGSNLVIGRAGGELIISAVAQAIMNKLWLGFDLRAAIAAPSCTSTARAVWSTSPASAR